MGLGLPVGRGRRSGPRAVGELPEPEVAGGLKALGKVSLRRIAGREGSLVWQRMQRDCHPQGEGLAPGVRVSYLIESERHGIVGGISFVAASWHGAAQDGTIGWSDRARVANLPRVISNDRFLILPVVSAPHLASHVLGKAWKQLADDLERSSGVGPLLIETCVEEGRPGTCYKAARWKRLDRKTSGRPPGAAGPMKPKTVWLRPMARAAAPRAAPEAGILRTADEGVQGLGRVRVRPLGSGRRAFARSPEAHRPALVLQPQQDAARAVPRPRRADGASPIPAQWAGER